jgi:hypothetical protein
MRYKRIVVGSSGWFLMAQSEVRRVGVASERRTPATATRPRKRARDALADKGAT